MKDLTKLKERALACHIIDDFYYESRLDDAVNTFKPFDEYVKKEVDKWFKYTPAQLIYLKEITWEYIIDESERITI